MNSFERLKAAQDSRKRRIEIDGVELEVVPLSAAQAQPLVKKFAGTQGLDADDPRLFDLYVELIAACVCEPGTTERVFDSDAGRELVRQLPMGHLFQLGFEAAEVCGLGGPKDSKKN